MECLMQSIIPNTHSSRNFNPNQNQEKIKLPIHPKSTFHSVKFINFIRLSTTNSPLPYSKPFSASTFNFVLIILFRNKTTITHQFNLFTLKNFVPKQIVHNSHCSLNSILENLSHKEKDHHSLNLLSNL